MNDVPFRPLRKGRRFGPDREFDAARVIQSNYGSNLEVVARNGDDLFHFYRSGEDWRGGLHFANNTRGVPGFIQSSFGERGNFQVVAGHGDGGLVHYHRNNDDPSEPWQRIRRFGDEDHGGVDAVSLIESNYGNLEIVFREGDDLYHMWRHPTGEWRGGRRIAQDVRGVPAFLQSSGGTRGHFEVLVPERSSGIRHLYRDNDDPSEPWIQTGRFASDLGDIDAVDAVEGAPGWLDVIAITDGGRLSFHTRRVSERASSNGETGDDGNSDVPEPDCPPPPGQCY